jgi:monofunctional biosynthetic peptidoglycan transglycosylase
LVATRLRKVLLGAAVPVLLLAGATVALYAFCPSVDFLVDRNPKTTSLIAARQRQGKVPKNLPSLAANWVPLRQIPELMQKTVIVAEDGGFFGHEGIDWHEVREAFKQNLKAGHLVRGASTITQQLAKNLFLSEERSWLRKVREIILTGRLEATLSKRRILELYLNVIEFGPGVFGIGAASPAFFGKPVGALTLGEMLRLAAVIPSPLSLSPTRPSERLERRARIILERLSRFGYTSAEETEQAERELEGFFNPNRPAATETESPEREDEP